jgi:hypothetical protein
MGTVIDLTAALWRRIATLEMEFAKCQRAGSQASRRNWRYKVYTHELIDAERAPLDRRGDAQRWSSLTTRSTTETAVPNHRRPRPSAAVQIPSERRLRAPTA